MNLIFHQENGELFWMDSVVEVKLQFQLTLLTRQTSTRECFVTGRSLFVTRKRILFYSEYKLWANFQGRFLLENWGNSHLTEYTKTCISSSDLSGPSQYNLIENLIKN